MVQFYETYSTDGFRELIIHYGMQNYPSNVGQGGHTANGNSFVPIGLAQIQNK